MRFLRRSWDRYSKLGKGRKKKQRWRKPTGRDNKMREKRRGYPKVVSIGYKKGNRKQITLIKNVNDLKNIKEKDMVIVGKIGKKKKLEIAKKAKEMKIELHNLNVKQLFKKIERKKKIEEAKKKAKEKKKKPVEKKKEKKIEKPKEEKKENETKE